MIVINTMRLRKVYLWPGFELFKAFKSYLHHHHSGILEHQISDKFLLNNPAQDPFGTEPTQCWTGESGTQQWAGSVQ
jgi:hypothetical protein